RYDLLLGVPALAHAGGPPDGESCHNPWSSDQGTVQAEGKRLARPHGETTDRPDAVTLSGDGVLLHAFQARGWIGEQAEPGKWEVLCPWNQSHSKGEDYDGSTVLFPPANGSLGLFYCSHSHCANRGYRDVLALFSKEELKAAGRAAGVLTPAPGCA